jgi:tRNA modification GTPase
MGIERSKEKIRLANVVLCMADASDPKSLSEVNLWVEQLKHDHPEKKIMLLANKVDVANHQKTNNHDILFISAKEGHGIDVLKSKLVALITGSIDLANDTIVSNVRHYDALRQTAEYLSKALYDLDNNISADFVAMDIRQAMYYLGTITGDISTDDLLGNIFSKFCIGK